MATSLPEYLQRLIRWIAGLEPITAAHVSRFSTAGRQGPFAELELWLVAPAGLPADAGQQLAGLGPTAYLGRTAAGWSIVTPEGLAITVTVVPHPAAVRPGLEPIKGAPGPEPGPAAAALPDVDAMAEAAAFWHGLYRAAGALSQGRRFQTHAELEQCRSRLLQLYRLALAPAGGAGSWEGLDQLDSPVLEGLAEWLVCPLEARAQWRCANRLAATYESLLLPLCQRLGLAYPWEIRNLAFAQLERAKPMPAGEGSPMPVAPGEPATAEPAPAESARTDPIRYKLKSRRTLA